MTFTGSPITTTGTLVLDGVLNIANGGTGATSQPDAANAILPSQTGAAGQYLTTDGTNVSWAVVSGGGGGSFNGGTVTTPITIASSTLPQLTVGTSTASGRIVSATAAQTNGGGLSIRAGGTTVGTSANIELRGGPAANNFASGGVNIVCESATGSGSGGTISITAGTAAGSGSGGGASVTAGSSSSANGGNANLTGGNTATGTFAGSVTLQGGNRTGTGGSRAGDVNLQGGSGGTGSAQGGLVDIRAGTGGTSNGPGGSINIQSGTGNNAAAGNITIISGISAAGGGYIALSTAATTSITERFRILNNGAWSVGTNGTSTGTSGQVLTSTGNSTAPTWQTLTIPYDFSAFVKGLPAIGETSFVYVVTRAFTLAANLGSSRVVAANAATASSVFSIRKNGTQFATATFGAAATVATLSSSSTTFAAGDIITIVAPGSQDATLANIAFNFTATL